MKVLLLSCDTGCGHNSAARAVGEAFDRIGVENKLVDPLSFDECRAGDIASAVYTEILRKAPGLFGALYKMGDIYSSTKITSPVYLANKVYSERLGRYIAENRYDRVVCTHLFPMEAVTALKKRGFSVPCYGVLTDYTCVPFFEETKLDGYFIPHDDLRHEMILHGMPQSRLISTGIPVSERFSKHVPKSEARERLGIPQNEKMLLVMSGGVGCGNIYELCGEIASMKNNFRAYILVGRNNEMKEEIDRRFGSSGRIKTVAFTDDVNLYMNAADAMISKPGGLTSTEAAVSGIPLVQLLTYTGCEAKNIEFFSSRGMSLKADGLHEAVIKALSLMNSPERSAKIIAAQRQNSYADAADRIAVRVIE